MDVPPDIRPDIRPDVQADVQPYIWRDIQPDISSDVWPRSAPLAALSAASGVLRGATAAPRCTQAQVIRCCLRPEQRKTFLSHGNIMGGTVIVTGCTAAIPVHFPESSSHSRFPESSSHSRFPYSGFFS